MGEPFVGEIRMFAGNFPPSGWAFCSGQLMPISENEVLFQLVGTTYGGDGQETFGIPDLQGRVPIHMGQGPGLSQNYQIGEKAGTETVTLTVNQIPSHNHVPAASSAAGDQVTPVNNFWSSTSTGDQTYDVAITPSGTLNTTLIGLTGGSQPHDNVAPFLCISFIISLFGVFPSQT
jgi:microcystin-dependent protein